MPLQEGDLILEASKCQAFRRPLCSSITNKESGKLLLKFLI